MKASEARELTIQNRKSIKDIRHTIEIMAKAGYPYAYFSKEKVFLTEEDIKGLKDDGYEVKFSETSLEINW